MPLTEAQKEYQRNWYRAKYASNPDERQRVSQRNKRVRGRKKKWLAEFRATLACMHCGEAHPACLDFHHKDSSQKRDAVANMFRQNLSLETIQAEIAKCEVLCANCHRKLHWQERQ